MGKENKCLRIRRKPWYIMIWLCVSTCLHNILMNGSNNVVISSLQKEFFLSSKETGIFVSVYDIGSMISVLLMSWLSTRVAKQKLISFGMFVLFLGCMLNVLTHFLRKTSTVLNNDNVVELCNDTLLVDSEERVHHLLYRANRTEKIDTSQKIGFTGIFRLKHLLYAANIVNGLSSASQTSILVSYIDDFSGSNLYVGIYYSVGAMGLAIGFLITSFCLYYHTDIDKKNLQLPEWLKPDHPNWIGAWWFPYLGFGVVSLILSFILFNLPTVEKKKKTKDIEMNQISNGVSRNDYKIVNQNDDIDPQNEESNRQASMLQKENSFLRSIEYIGSTLNVNQEENLPKKAKVDLKRFMGLFKNPIYILLLIAWAIEGLLQNSFLAFAPLFLEYQYRLSSARASFYIGMLSIIPLVLGGICSGVISEKFLGNDIRRSFKFVIFVLVFNTIIFVGFLLNCKEPLLLSSNPDFQNPLKNISSNCFTTAPSCNCDPTVFKPVCLNGSSDIVFQSPCLAGCMDFSKKNNYFKNDFYYNCSQSSCNNYYPEQFLLSNKPSESYFTDGFCPSGDCFTKMILSFSSIAFLMFFNAILFTPYTSLLTKCFDEKDGKELNSIILGIKQFTYNAWGTIPGPILFGAIIDFTCKYWHTNASGQTLCKFYNNREFAYGFGWLGIGFKAINVILMVICLILANKKLGK